MSNYNPAIPQPTDRISTSQQQILGNFAQLDTSFAVNHLAFSDNSSFNGMHTVCQIKELAGTDTPPPPFLALTDALYTQLSNAGGTFGTYGELFYMRGGATVPIKMTCGNPKGTINGYSFLPGGILIQWGQTKTGLTSSGNTLVTFSTSNIAFPNTCFVAFAQIAGVVTANFALNVSNLTNTTFNIRSNPPSPANGTDVLWLAIGN